MKKKLLVLLLSFVMLLIMACGNTNTEESQNSVSEESEVTEETEITEETTQEVEGTVEEIEEPEEIETPAPTEEPVEEPLAEVPEVVEEPQAQYTYTDLSATMYAQQNVNVRDLPSTDGNKLGGLSTNEEVTVTGQCNETNWYLIEYNDGVGFVSNNYLGDSIVEVAKTPGTSSSSGGYTTFYMENSGGTWYSSSDGMTCDYYNNSMGCMVNDACYTLQGMLAAYPNLGQAVYNEDGSIKIAVCGCCSTVYENYGIPSFVQAYSTAQSLGYPNGIKSEQTSKNWVADTPNTWPHNITWYYFSK